MSSTFAFVTIFSLLFFQAFARGPDPLLQRQASTTSIAQPTDNIPPSCLDQCTDILNAWDSCISSSDFYTCICTGQIVNACASCLSYSIANNPGSSSTANDILNQFITSCGSPGVPTTSQMLDPPKSTSPSVVAIGLSLIGCMIGIVLGAGMIFV